MPSQPSNQAVQQQQDRQQALTAMLASAMLAAWSLIDLSDLAGSLPKYEAAVAALVYKYGQASAVLAAHFYRAQRAAAGVAGTFKPVAADPAGIEQVQKSMGWATKGLWTPPVAPERAVAATETVAAPVVPDPAPVVEAAKVLAQGAAQKMVVDTGRNTLIDAIEKDKECRGWARQARPDGCSFCAMLSTRGMVYKEHSFDASNARFTGGDSTIKVHDHCHCVPVPVFADHYEPPAYVREWQQIYKDSTRGKSNAEARNAFRVALDKHRSPAAEPALAGV